MDKGRYLVEAHVREGRPVAELAAAMVCIRAGSTGSWPATAPRATPG